MKNSIYLSIGLLLLVTLWMLSGAMANAPDKKNGDTAHEKVIESMEVTVVDSESKPIVRDIIVQGELEPLRQIEIQSQVESKVIALPVKKGQRILAETLLMQLDEEDRAAQIRRARADVNNQQFELSAAQKLKKQGLQAENRLKASLSALAMAQADLKRAQLQLQYTRIKAPFDGVMEQRYVELGTHVEPGEKLALIIDESVLKAVADISQQSIQQVSLGQMVQITLLDGRVSQGTISYISRVGDSETHSFRIEADIANADLTLNAGVSAKLSIAVGKENAHFISPAVLSLNDEGTVGVKSVNKHNKVVFYATDLIRSEANGIWVSGLPQRVQMITQGHAYVNSGEKVTPVTGQ